MPETFNTPAAERVLAIDNAELMMLCASLFLSADDPCNSNRCGLPRSPDADSDQQSAEFCSRAGSADHLRHTTPTNLPKSVIRAVFMYALIDLMFAA